MPPVYNSFGREIGGGFGNSFGFSNLSNSTIINQNNNSTTTNRANENRRGSSFPSVSGNRLNRSVSTANLQSDSLDSHPPIHSLRKSASTRFTPYSLTSRPSRQNLNSPLNSSSSITMNHSLIESSQPSMSSSSSSFSSSKFKNLTLFNNGNYNNNVPIKKLVINHSSAPSAASIRGINASKEKLQQEKLNLAPKPSNNNNNNLSADSSSNPSSSSSSSSTQLNSRQSLHNLRSSINSPITLGTPVRNPAISRVYEINKTAVDAGYWIDPSLEVLFSYTFDQLHAVEDLKIGRKNYGNIRYIQPVDLSTINNLSDLLGNLVVFGHLSVCVYPEDGKGKKPPPGIELNMPAIVTLENIFTLVPAGTAKLKITDPSDYRAKSKCQSLRALIESRGGEFITYDAASGVFVFKVNHFSSWGFTDDDLIYDEPEEQQILNEQQQQQPQQQQQLNHHQQQTMSNMSFGNRNTNYFNESISNDTYSRLHLDSNPLDLNSTAEDTFAHKLNFHDSSPPKVSSSGFSFNPPSKLAHSSIKTLKIESQSAPEQSQNPFQFPPQSQSQPQSQNQSQNQNHTQANNGLLPNMKFSSGPFRSAPILGTHNVPNLGPSEPQSQLQPQPQPQLQPQPQSQPQQQPIFQNEQNGSIPTTQPQTDSSSFAFNNSAGDVSMDMSDDNYQDDDISNVEIRGSGTDSIAQDEKAIIVFDGENEQDEIEEIEDEEALFEEKLVSKDWITQLSYASTFDSTFAPLSREKNKGNNIYRNDEPTFDTFTAADLDATIFGGEKSLEITSTVGQYNKAAAELKLPEPFSGFSFGKFSSSSFILKRQTAPSSFAISDSIINKNNVVPPYFIDILKDLIHNSNFTSRDNGFPLASPPQFLTFDYIKSKFPHNSSRDLDIVLLASLLFDDLSELGVEPLPNTLSESAAEKVSQQFRSKLLSQWVAKVVAGHTMDRVISNSNDPLAQTLAHIFGNNITKASVAASKGNNLHLATVIPLLGSPDDAVRQIAQNQINDWVQSSTLAFIPPAVRTVFELLSGNTTVSRGIPASGVVKEAPTLFISQGLTWLQAFGLRLWYECTILKPIPEAVLKYEQAFSSPSNKVPTPYINSQQTICYIEYELLALYDSLNPDIGKILNPLSSSDSPFDFKVPWLLHHILVRSLHRHSDRSNTIGDKLAVDFSSQLEAHGHFTEAVFVLTHLSSDNSAMSRIQNLLARNIEKLTESDYSVLLKIGIPKDVFPLLRALKFRFDGDYWSECDQLLVASYWEEAHRRIIKTVAPKAVISNDLGSLLDLLLRFSKPELIPSWSKGSQVYLDYIYIVEELGPKETVPQLDSIIVFSESTKGKAKAAYAKQGLTISEVGSRLMKGLSDIDVDESFEVKVAVNLMASFLCEHIKLLGLEDQSALALQMNMDSTGYLQQTVQLSSFYFRNRISV